MVLSPLRLGAWADDRYHLDELYYRWFCNDARTIGVIPTASNKSGFGIGGGLRFVDRDVPGSREHLLIEARIGGRYSQVYKRPRSSTRAAARSGARVEPG